MDCLPDVNLVYIYPLLKQLYDNLVGIDKCSTTNVLQVCHGKTVISTGWS